MWPNKRSIKLKQASGSRFIYLFLFIIYDGNREDDDQALHIHISKLTHEAAKLHDFSQDELATKNPHDPDTLILVWLVLVDVDHEYLQKSWFAF